MDKNGLNREWVEPKILLIWRTEFCGPRPVHFFVFSYSDDERSAEQHSLYVISHNIFYDKTTHRIIYVRLSIIIYNIC